MSRYRHAGGAARAGYSSGPTHSDRLPRCLFKTPAEPREVTERVRTPMKRERSDSGEDVRTETLERAGARLASGKGAPADMEAARDAGLPHRQS